MADDKTPAAAEVEPEVAPAAAAHAKAVKRLLAEGYKDMQGNKHRVRSEAHAEFLLKTGSVAA